MREPSSSEEDILLELAAIDASNFRSAVRRILKLDAKMLGVGRVNFWFIEPDPLTIHCEEGYLAESDSYESGRRLRAEDNPRYFEAIRTEQVVAVDDAHRDPRTADFTASYLEPLGITSMLDAPVWQRGSLAAILCHEHVGPPRRWTAREKELGVYVAQTLARALEARLRAQVSFLYDATAILTESLDIAKVPERLARLTVPLLGDWCVIDVLDDGALSRLGATHAQPDKAPLLAELVDGEAGPLFVTVAATRTAAPLLLGEVSAGEIARRTGSARQAEILHAIGAHALMAVPFVAHGRVLGAIGVGSGDPSRRYRAEDLELAVALTQRAAIAIENARLYGRLEAALQLRDEFLSVAAHELYTPIQSLQLAVDGLAGDGGDLSGEAAVRYLGVVRRQVKRLSSLVEGLLDVSKIRGGKLALSIEPVDLAAVVRDLVEQHAAEIGRSGCRVEVRADEPVIGRWDRMRLEQVVTNLLGNALKFGRGREVELLVERTDRLGRLQVRSHGVGLERDQLERIFDPFRRAVSSRQYGGLGLGLYIVRQIVSALGGAVWAQSSREQGTVFTVELPISGPAELDGEAA